MTTLPSPIPSDREGAPIKKWTILNDEWVQATFLLFRSASGFSDINFSARVPPAQPTSSGARTGSCVHHVGGNSSGA